MEHASPYALTRAGFFVREPQRNSFDLLRAFRIRGSSRMGYPSTKCVCHLTLFFCKACFAHRLLRAAAFYNSRFRMVIIAKRRIAALYSAIRQSHLLKLALASPATIVLGGMRDKPEKRLYVAKVSLPSILTMQKAQWSIQSTLAGTARSLRRMCFAACAYSFNRQSPSAAQAQKACLPWRAFHG